MSIKKRLLIVSQEVSPYNGISEIAELVKNLPEFASKKGMEIRVLMPRFGTINERRHRLHEVVRLSGMNIVVGEDDYPLTIKVASLPNSRIQVYFLDNEDFFRRKGTFEDDNGIPFTDNGDRMVFFCKGVLETVKKFGWQPDIVHCHGWMTSLLPLYLKTMYKNDPVFRNAKVIYSIYSPTESSSFPSDFLAKVYNNHITSESVAPYIEDNMSALDKGAYSYSDAVVQGSENIDADVYSTLVTQDKPFLSFQTEQDNLATYLEFYQTLLAERVEQ